MTGLIQDIDASQLDLLLAREQRVLLLVFWAAWHFRSAEVREEAEYLAHVHADEIALATVNVDREIDLAIRYGMRSVPLLILFRCGVEVARTVAPGGRGGVLPWLWRNDAVLTVRPDNFEIPGKALHGAFHGDALFRQAVIGSVRDLACRHAIVRQRIPFWRDGHGTISGALAGCTRPDVVEARSGLPFSFACALEFLHIEWSEATVDAVFSEIASGADLSMIAIRLVRDVLADPATDWAGLIEDERIDLLRMRWLRLVDRYVCTLPVAREEWDEILVGLGMLRSRERAPLRSVQDAFIDMLSTLSPPPAHDDDLWVSALSLHGIYLLHVLVEYDLGWGRDDFAFEGWRGQWFAARERMQADGRFTSETLAEAQKQWMHEHGDAQIRYDEMLVESSEAFSLLSNRIRQRLIALLRESAART